MSNKNKVKDIILVLGMVYTDIKFEELKPYGQERRDYKRILSLLSLGYEVFSLDDKHEPIIGRHCQANFNDPRRMIYSISMQKCFSFDLNAKYILLDYFFSPDGWNSYRWNETFFTKTLLYFPVSGILSYNGEVWLPNMKCVEDYLKDHKTLLEIYYTITLVNIDNILSNPLVLATENIKKELEVDNFVNENQLIRLNKLNPFFKLVFNK